VGAVAPTLGYTIATPSGLPQPLIDHQENRENFMSTKNLVVEDDAVSGGPDNLLSGSPQATGGQFQ